MIDFDRLLGKLLQSGAAAGFGGGLAGGLAASLLSTRRGRKLGASAVKLGGVAAIGALAYHALQRHQASQAGAGAPRPAPRGATAGGPEPAALGPDFLPAAAPARQRLAMTLIRAMIAAAHADGAMDAEETQRVFQALLGTELSAEEKAFLVDEMAKPAAIDDLVQGASSKEAGAEIYAAALVAIQVDHPAERVWLELLAERLGLDEELVGRLKGQVAAPSGP